MLSNFEIAAIALLLVNIGLSIYCLSKKSSEEDYAAQRSTPKPPAPTQAGRNGNGNRRR